MKIKSIFDCECKNYEPISENLYINNCKYCGGRRIVKKRKKTNLFKNIFKIFK